MRLDIKSFICITFKNVSSFQWNYFAIFFISSFRIVKTISRKNLNFFIRVKRLTFQLWVLGSSFCLVHQTSSYFLFLYPLIIFFLCRNAGIISWLLALFICIIYGIIDCWFLFLDSFFLIRSVILIDCLIRNKRNCISDMNFKQKHLLSVDDKLRRNWDDCETDGSFQGWLVGNLSVRKWKPKRMQFCQFTEVQILLTRHLTLKDFCLKLFARP